MATGVPAGAQVAGTVDVGLSSVQYDGYLAAGAAYVNPTVRYEAPDVSLGLQGSGVMFETGNHILQAAAAGAWRSRAFGRWRVEVSGSGGVTSYSTDEEDYPAYGHGLGRVRMHYAARRSGAWVDAASGRSFFGDATDIPIEVGGGAWIAGVDLAANGRIVHTWLGDGSYLDVTASLRWVHDRFEATGKAGFRTASTEGGSGAWAEGLLQVSVVGPVSALIAGGRYPSDPVRGVLAATYVSAGVRIALLGDGRQRPPRQPERTTDASPGLPRVRIEEVGRDSLALVITATAGDIIELAGDFTDWLPVRLAPSGEHTWVFETALEPGIYRMNVRIDGGPWLVPAGFSSIEDDFDSRVALLVIP